MWQFLIDTTPELRVQAIQHEIEWLDGVFLTHSHADHVMGLDDLRRFNAVMRSPLDIYAEPDTLASVKKMFSYIFQTGGQVNKTFIAQLVPHTLSIDDSLKFGAASWKPIRLFHGNLPIVGYRIDVELSSRLAFKIAYCTDVSRIPDETFEHLQGLDVLVIDALRYRSHPTHMTVEQALHAIEMIRPKRAYLTHIAHDILHRDLQEKLPENVFLAYDGLVVRCE